MATQKSSQEGWVLQKSLPFQQRQVVLFSTSWKCWVPQIWQFLLLMLLCPWHPSAASTHTWPYSPQETTCEWVCRRHEGFCKKKSLCVFRNKQRDGTVHPEPKKNQFLLRPQIYKEQKLNAQNSRPLQLLCISPCTMLHGGPGFSNTIFWAGLWRGLCRRFSLRGRASAQTCRWQGWRRQRAPCPCPCCRACVYAYACACASSSSSCARGDDDDGARCV